jgi:uncharacterized protein
MSDSNTRLQKIAEFVHTHLQETYLKHPDRDDMARHLFGLDYRWLHTLRVAQFGKQLAETEGADVELVIAGCLLHDVAAFEMMENDRDHGRIGAQVARPLLEKIGYTPEQIENIYVSVAEHADVKNPSTLEAKVVTDADNVDRFWAYRILQWCLPDIGDYHQLAETLRARIAQLEEYKATFKLCTPSGQELFLKRLDFQIGFYKEFVEQHDLSTLPQV